MSDIEAIAALNDPVRRRLYDYVASQDRHVSRNEAAEAAQVQRTLAAFHLDRLVEAGLLETARRRLTGKTGPGAGRPAKLYRRVSAERAVSLPPRAYDLAAAVLAEAVERAGADTHLHATARERGVVIGRAAAGESLTEVLQRQGYQPYEDGPTLRLRNCPFHRLAQAYPPLACGMNLALCEGIVEGLGIGDREVRLDPRPGECCVAVISKTNDS